MSVSPRKFGAKAKINRPLAEFVSAALGDAFVKHGFAQGDLILHWADIVGEKIAAQCLPVKLQWPTGARKRPDGAQEPATLFLQVDGAAALEIQHVSGVILQRVNGFFGWRCVGRIALKQAPMPRKSAPARKSQPGADTLAKAQEATSDIEDDNLRAALIRLGSRVISRKP